MLNCPACARLIHAAKLTELAAQAQAAEASGRIGDSLRAWREALSLLPPGTKQFETIQARVVELSKRLDAAPKLPWWRRVSSLGPVGVLAAMLGKAKFLLLGLTKLGTLLSFAGSLAIYWTLWGWQFALCFLISIYIHEMGHVEALHRYGIPASAPTFIPGFGALVRLKQHPASAREDATVGLAGPLWGLGAAIVSFGLYLWTRSELWAAVAHVGAWLNLFNLIPVWQLDGSRGIRPLDRTQVWMLAILTTLMWVAVDDGMLILLALVLAYQAIRKPREGIAPDWPVMLQFAGLIVALSLLCLIPLPNGR